MIAAQHRRLVRSCQLATVLGLLIAAYGCATQSFGDVPSGLLPQSFHVYTDSAGLAVNHPVPGYARVRLRTVNLYLGDDGCYVLVTSHNARGSAYSTGHGTFALGQMRVRGHYEGRFCIPAGDETAGIGADRALQQLAGRVFPGHGGDVTPSGDTGGWFGVD